VLTVLITHIYSYRKLTQLESMVYEMWLLWGL